MSFHVSLVACRWTVSQLVMQREEQALNHPLDMVAHVQPWMLIPIVPLIIVFEGLFLQETEQDNYSSMRSSSSLPLVEWRGG